MADTVSTGTAATAGNPSAAAQAATAAQSAPFGAGQRHRGPDHLQPRMPRPWPPPPPAPGVLAAPGKLGVSGVPDASSTLTSCPPADPATGTSPRSALVA